MQPGDIVRLRQQRWRVERARREPQVCRLDLVNRSGRRTFLLPFDRVDGRDQRERVQITRPAHAWRTTAAVLARACGWRSLPAVLDADLAIYSYQLEPALALAAGARRVLVADEVGLGKTLQAGLAIAELTSREPHARVLVLLPSPLVAQWADELRRRFRLEVRVGDRAGVDAAALDVAFGDNPWHRAGVWLATLDFLKQAHVLGAVRDAAWDLVVVDEAHMAAGRSDRHEAAHAIATRARRVVLLTATPHTGDPDRFQRLVDLGTLGDADDPLVVLHRTRATVGLRHARRVHWRRLRLSAAETAALDALQRFERALLRVAGARRPAALLLLSIFRKRALSTFTALAASLERRLSWLDRQPHVAGDDWRQPRLFADADDDGAEELEGLTADVGMDAVTERRWLTRLAPLARQAAHRETKIARLRRQVAATPAPVVVFTEFRDSLRPIASHLSQVREVAVLHGGLRPDEQREALASFLEGRASVLVATDVAAQGLNLQSRARWIVNFELPWNPARLEQRAGRVDRFGQRGVVHITVFVVRHRADADLLRHLARRTLDARRSIGQVPFAWAAAIPDHAIRDAVLTGRDADLQAAQVGAFAATDTWTRSARALARDLSRRRALLVAARGVRPDTGRVVCGRDRRSLHSTLGRAAAAVVAVPLLDASGAMLEQRIVAFRLNGAADAVSQREIADALRERALAIVVPRAHRLIRLLRATSARALAIDERLARSLQQEQQRLPQPGLFDRKSSTHAAAGPREIDDSIGHGQVTQEPVVIIGRPRVLVVAPLRS